jgi:hypothetical protein
MQVSNALSVLKFEDTFIDEYTDLTGVNLNSSINLSYFSANKFFTPDVGGNDSYTKLLLSMNGSDASTTIPDSSGTSKGNATIYGAAQLDTAQKKFGTASLLLGGDATSSYIAFGDSADYDFGSGSWSFDFWAYSVDTSGHNYYFCREGTGGYYQWGATVYNGVAQLAGYTGTGGTTLYAPIPTMSVSTGQWDHFAFTSDGTTVRGFKNGLLIGTCSFPAAFLDITGGIHIGQDSAVNAGYYFNGWIDEFRLSKGICRWNATFLPPTTAYETASYKNMTLISNSQTATTQPSEARIIIREEDVDAITINTDLLAYASRDGGTTWDLITLVLEGPSISPNKIYAGTVTLTSTGTSMLYKIVTANNKNLKIHATALAWK